ncbi:MAG: CPBP family intramembrane metalloprotease [Planctomycetaceae bacterium]|nr:CPBP family intramembrane metalloprotease [Planctomycetaceae bacterium]
MTMQNQDLSADSPRDSGLPPADKPATYRRRLWRVGRIARKELREALRDRRTLMTLILMPLIVYPLLGTVMQKFLLQQLTAATGRTEMIVCFDSPEAGRYLQHMLAAGNRLVESTEAAEETPADSSRPVEEEESPTGPPALDKLFNQDRPIHLDFRSMDSSQPGPSLEEMVRSGAVDLGLRLTPAEAQPDETTAVDPPDTPAEDTGDSVAEPDTERLLHANGAPGVELLWNPTYDLSRRAMRFARERIEALNLESYRQRLKQARLSDHPAARLTDRRLEGEATSFSLVTFVPLMLVLMTVTGAVYPAIDLTAGERERGTLEILVATPVPQLDLLFGKFVAVLAVAMLTAVVNLLALVITVTAGGLEQLLFGTAGLSVVTLTEILLLLFVFAAFFSAVLLALTSFARSFKEAQAWLIPLMLLALAPGVLSLMPDVRMTGWLAVLPVVNLVLLGRDLLQHDVSLPLAGVALVSTGLYALLALTMAARVFGTDAILYGSAGGWADLLKQPEHPRQAPPLSLGVFVLAAQFPLFIVLGSLAGRLAHLSTSARLGVNSLVLIVLFLLLPLLVAWRAGIQRKSAFRLSAPHWSGVLAAVLLGISLWPLVFQLEVWTLPRARIEELIELFRSMGFDPGSVPLAVRLVSLAAVPAFCEEFFFRGFLQSAFRRASRPRTAVLLSSVAFALFHIVVRDSLMFERFLPSLLLGLVLGTVCIRTESLWPGMLLHVLHNSLVLSISDLAPWLPDWGFDEIGATRLPLPMLAGAVVVAGCGAAVLLYCRPAAPFPSADSAEHGTPAVSSHPA